jgi:hypothetical protein
MSRNLISFRLDPVHLELLARRAGSGTSNGNAARDLVIRALNEQHLNDAVEARLSSLHDEIARLRTDLRMTLQTIIAASTRISLAEAEAHVKRILG